MFILSKGLLIGSFPSIYTKNDNYIYIIKHQFCEGILSEFMLSNHQMF